MNNNKYVRQLVLRGLWITLLFTLSGCYTYRPLPVRVEDAATGKPLQGAHVSAGNRVYLNFFPPKESEGYTDADGKVKLSLAPDAGGAPFVEATMPGYSLEYEKITEASLRVSGPAHELPELVIPLQRDSDKQ